MSTNPLGPGTRNISTNVPNDLYIAVYEMAQTSGVKIGEFMRALMRFAQERKVVVRPNAEDQEKWRVAVNADLHPLPEVRHEVIFTDELQLHPKSLDEMVADTGQTSAGGQRRKGKTVAVEKSSRKLKTDFCKQ